MFGIQPTAYDQKIYSEELAEFLPEKMIDVHIHLWKESMRRLRPEDRKGAAWPVRVASECTVEDLLESYQQMFPGKSVKPILMTMPSADLKAGNPYALRCAKEYHLPVLYCTRHDTSPEEIKKAVREEGFCGIKPYLYHAPDYIPAKEVRVFDFLTPVQLELINELEAAVILHIPRAGRLKDPLNLAQMREIDRKYPRAKVIVAHIGRAYTPEDLGDAFSILRESKNLLFDFSANTFDGAMIECIKAVGTKRVLFGSDMPITKMRMYRVMEEGTYLNVIPRGLYGEVYGAPHIRESDETDITTFMYEELLAFKRCAKTLSLSRTEIEDIFYNNASSLFGLKF